VSVFADLGDYFAVPRINELQLSPDGTRLVATVSSLNADGNRYVDAIWEIDPLNVRASRRLTFSDSGESAPCWLPDGSLLFTSARGGDDDGPAALWLLPAGGGEGRKVIERPGGIVAVAVARQGSTVVVSSPTLPASDETSDETLGETSVDAASSDEALRTARKDAKVSAVLHEVSPIRFWDHDLGPAELRLFATEIDPAAADTAPIPRDLTPVPQRSLDEQSFVLTPDGGTLVTGWAIADEPGYPRPQLVAIDVRTAERRVLADDPYVFYADPAVSHDGRYVACIRVEDSTYDESPRPAVWLIELATGAGRPLAADADLWPSSPVWSPDGASLFFTSDDHGHHPIYRVDIGTEQLARVTRAGHFASVSVSPDGRVLYALRDHIDSPPTPVRIDASGTDADAEALIAPGGIEVPGRLEEVSTRAEDGTTIRGWLALPSDASAGAPAPLLLWIHGGPLSSWNAWTWRWNPWLMTAKGYAVLLPDPALSTGYGRAMVQRGWGQWGGAPYTDLMALTDEVLERGDVDETRTAAMGGSYGGYMANWVAGHTDRFRCIVTHASLWALDQFQGTTDHPAYWAREWGLPSDAPGRYEEWSPHKFVDAISTPMLVIHGDKDYRVPVGEGLRLWWDLQRRQVESKFLYFPDEGHWVLKPGNARVWYETVWAWLAVHVLGESWERPPLV
jgi:dipeptidyl aminopeptidase/acylaminoacyl peptidase